MEKQPNRHWNLYVLKLDNDKWYIGITTDVEKRFHQHKSGFASSSWTRIHKPLKLQDTRYLGDITATEAQKIEGRILRKYMQRYGDDNVRGGDVTDIDQYGRRFARFITKNDWQVVASFSILILVILFLLIF